MTELSPAAIGLCDFMLGTAKIMITELVEDAHQARAHSRKSLWTIPTAAVS